MMKTGTFPIFLILCSLTFACTDENPNQSGNGGPGTGGGTGSNDWLVPSNEVFGGGPGKDGIPALETPEMISAAAATYLRDDDLVIGFRSGNDVRAYSHKVLDWHEIINDDVNGTALAVTYCPLTGTAIGWDRNISGGTTTFGVSGLLYNTNLIPYDRLTDSNWSQIRLDCVNGNLIGEKIKTIALVETTWRTWKEMYPNTTVVSTNTGFSRDYQRYPYFSGARDYRIDPFLIFPIDSDDSRLERKARVHGVIENGEAKVYNIADLNSDITVIEDSHLSLPIVVVGSSSKNFAVSFERNLSDGTQLSFTALQNQLPLIMEDNEGNKWDVFGEAISGPRQGEKLKSTESFIGYWFSWGAFYENATIYN